MAIISYKCTNSGGPVKYSAALQKFNCEYCGSEYTQEEVKNMPPLSQTEDVVTTGGEGEYLEYHCPSCGANIVTDETTVATTCYYCNNPVVLAGKFDSSQMPTRVIPFKVEKSKAVEFFDSWIKTKKFVPKTFYNNKREIEEINGVYFPYWLYDTTVHVDLDREGTRRYTRTEGDYKVTYEKHFRIIRKGDVEIKNLPKIALAKSNKVLVESVYPIDFNAAIDFDATYLSGFVAENKDIPKEDLTASIQEDVISYSSNVVRESMTGETVNVVGGDFSTEPGRFSYAMLPVWTVSYNDKESEKNYFFSVNGQSGKVVGELPVDMAKLCLSGLLISLPLLAIIALVLYFTDNLTTATFIYGLIASVIVYIGYVVSVNNDYKMKSASVKNRVVNQIAFNNNYSESIEYRKDIDLGTRVVGRQRIEKKS